jgi:Tol biopolymer transport system component
VVGVVKQGEALNLIGRPADSQWLQACCYKNAPGWISASLVTVPGKVGSLPVPKDMPKAPAAGGVAKPAVPKAPAVAAGGAAKPGVPKGVLLYSVLNKDADRWELWQHDFASGKSTFLKEWRTEVSFSPDFKAVAYFAWPGAVGDQAGVYAANPDLSGERLVFRGDVSYPSWSPDRGRLVMNGGTDQGLAMAIINADGGGLRLLALGEYPAWSPKSNWIAHRACVGGGCGIYLTDADTGAQQRLTTGGGDGQPAWSPNGQQIAYISKDDGNFEIYRVNADSSNKVRLTSDPASDGLPTWSPDGNWIAFRSDRGGTWAIYIMRPDGKDLRKVTDAPVLPLWFWEKMSWRP